MTTITPSQEQHVVDQVPKQLYIAGEWRDGSKGTLTVEDPSTEEPLCDVADASVDDAKAALDAAVDAGPEFAAMAPRDRGEILRRAFETITARKDELALLMTLEMGKTIKESLAEIAYAAEFFRWFSEESVRIDGRYTVAANGAGRILTMKQPVGPCLMITPWNFPLAMGTRKIGPAVARGHGGELGAGVDGGVQRGLGVVHRGVGDVAQRLLGRGVLDGEGALGAVAPLTGDVELLGDLLDDLLFLGGGDRGHALNLLLRCKETSGGREVSSPPAPRGVVGSGWGLRPRWGVAPAPARR